MDCIFCKIINGDIPAKIIYRDDRAIAFDDLYPKAPIHKLIIPTKHISTLNDITPDDKELLGAPAVFANHNTERGSPLKSCGLFPRLFRKVLEDRKRAHLCL